MFEVDFHVTDIHELDKRFKNLEFAEQKKILSRLLHFSMIPMVKMVKLLSPYSDYSNKWFSKSFRKAWKVHGYWVPLPTVVFGVKRANKVKYTAGNTDVYESSAYTRFWHNDGTEFRTTKDGVWTGRIRPTHFTDNAVRLTQQTTMDRFVSKMKKEIEKL